MLKPNRIARIIALFSFLFILQSCGQYQQLLRSDDYEKKYEMAIEYYEEEDYGRTIALLEDVIPVYRGTPEAETINYYYALAHYEQGSYALASHYLKTFVDAYPRSEHAEEFLFLSAYCNYLESPRYSLDQTSTREAIRSLQNFINRYPNSEKVTDANDLIDELRLKLEKKRYDKANLYMKIGDYLAAAITFETLVKDFPDTEYREEAFFMAVKAYYEYASFSIVQRQEERYEDVLQAYRELARRYPDGEYIDEAEKLRDSARQAIEEVRKMDLSPTTEREEPDPEITQQESTEINQ